MIIELKSFLTVAELRETIVVAKERNIEQVKDIKQGKSNAAYSYGSKGSLYTRTPEERYTDALIGAIAEKIASKVTNSKWTKERRQYDGNKNSDLMDKFDGLPRRCEVRGSRYDFIIHRKKRDADMPNDTFLIGVTNLPTPKDKVCEVVYTTFKEMRDLCIKHPEWLKGEYTNSPYYTIPPSFLHSDFSKFIS